jgi:hypothetical protein
MVQETLHCIKLGQAMQVTAPLVKTLLTLHASLPSCSLTRTVRKEGQLPFTATTADV